MYKHYKKVLWAGLIVLLFNACKEDEFKPLHNDGTAPGRVEESSVENLHGAAKITTILPDDADLMYVKATVEVAPGKIREFTASAFKNELLLEGFGESKPYEVKLSAVDRGENASEPISVMIHPLKPPVVMTYETLVVRPDFGGINVSFQNVTQANLAIEIQIKDSNEDWVEHETLYTKKAAGNFSTRGFPAEEREFRIFVKDRWGNKSETGSYTITPLFEELIPKTGFKIYNLPGDNYVQHCCGVGVSNIWDGIIGAESPVFHTKPSNGIPGTFTFDMGVPAILSRMKLWGRDQGLTVQFNVGNIKSFEVWGSEAAPLPSGEFPGNMILLGTFEVQKPSGQPLGKNTTEDIETARAGFDFNFELGLPPVRYLRVKVISNWGGVTFWYVSETAFWGQINR